MAHLGIFYLGRYSLYIYVAECPLIKLFESIENNNFGLLQFYFFYYFHIHFNFKQI